MAIPNEASVLSSNGETSAPSTKRKSARKAAPSPAREPAPVAAKRSANRASSPVEILFTQEPNPHREPVAPYIWIDFPIQSEALRAPTYVIRLGVGGADLVEISIDKSPWLPCRLTSGYWWYDWSKIARGKHTLVARMRLPDGRWFKTPPRPCDYKP
jgi:hypothetical protein